MRRRSLRLIALLASVATALSSSSAMRAQEQERTPDRDSLTSQRLTLDPRLKLSSDLSSRLLERQSGPTKVVIELTDQPTTEVYAASARTGVVAQAAVQAQQALNQIQQAQLGVMATLQDPAIDAKVIYRTQRVYNGIAVQVDASKLAQIAALPDVKAIHPLITHTLDNASSVPLIGAPDLWKRSGLNKTGQGIRIGIIDTGIDYLHTHFGGSGLEADYARNDTKVVGDVGFPSAKVVGGYDFAGDLYNPLCTPADVQAGKCTTTPQPDPDPMDCQGHGTHVAGTAAGFGVNRDGSTYRGAYGLSTPFDALRVGPGVAPQALLYALRVFGCEGATDVVVPAIEWAVDPNGDGDFSDRLDVLNMSLGALGGSPYDSTAVASDNAAAVGVIVVASAGNSGDTFYVTGSPGSANRVISVASSADKAMILDAFRVNAPLSIAGFKPALESVLFDWTDKQAVTGNLVYPPTQRSGCQPFDAANKALLAGKIALLDWTKIDEEHECRSGVRVNNAADAGAIAVIFVYPEPIIDILLGGSPRIPSVITLPSVGAQLKAHLNENVNVTLSPEFAASQKVVIPELTDTLSDFSSRGPRRGDSALKPDLAAPGQTIFSADALTGNKGQSLNGTSMAAPHVAGSMALLRQLHPSWTVEELKALAMNTANNDVRSEIAADSPIHGPTRMGAGRITLPNAAASKVVAYNATEPGVVSLSFGAVEVVGEATAVRQIRVVNKSNERVTYSVSYRSLLDTPGVSYALGQSSVTLEPYGSAMVAVTLTANAAEMKHTHDPTINETQLKLPRHWLSEEAGLVLLRPASGPSLRVPVHAAARPAAAMRAASGLLNFGEYRTANIRLVGTGVNTVTGRPNLPLDEISVVTALELQHSSPNDASSVGLADAADLKYVGVASDVMAAKSIADTTIAFGIATHGDWSTPNVFDVEFDIYIDTNRDGTPDFALFNIDLGLATGSDPTDVFITVLVNLSTGAVSPQHFLNGVPASALNTVPYNTNVVVMPVAAADLGLTAANASFDYAVATFQREAGDAQVDQSSVLTYNAARPGLDLSDGVTGVPIYLDLPGESIPLGYDPAAFRSNKSQGVLLLHHHNTRDRRTEVVRIRGVEADEPASRLYLPSVGARR